MMSPSISLQEVYVSRETTGKIAVASKLMWCSAAVDVLFLLDGSHSVGKGSFERSKHFAMAVCDALDISPGRWAASGPGWCNDAHVIPRYPQPVDRQHYDILW
ncbi:hypothetical protein U0070_023186 [Myodes glareolus]|uniref:VWFA domain-containing protein n=1 Tax=Myodes glareolus TaxID=447135 RepID=A0AAW0IBZ1_MYOGA